MTPDRKAIYRALSRMGREKMLWRCLRKIVYPTWAEAEEIALRFSIAKAESIHTYQCVYCAQYHIGHTRFPKRRVQVAQYLPSVLKNAC